MQTGFSTNHNIVTVHYWNAHTVLLTFVMYTNKKQKCIRKKKKKLSTNYSFWSVRQFRTGFTSRPTIYIARHRAPAVYSLLKEREREKSRLNQNILKNP